ncbi:hypothetical protein [Serratia sp. CY85251]|uniref:hypothetical protein n=1 Tax=Serratia sp. CY85251 TaxID=3383696 RepID=UPI003F9F55A1
MSKAENKIILMDDAEAASIQTLTGWVDRHGRYWGNDEQQARWCGATHRKCKNKPDEHPIHSTHRYCEECHRESRQATFAKMERAVWAGKRICELDDLLEAANKRIADLEAKLTRAEKHIVEAEEYIEKVESAWKRINELEINEKQMLRDHYCAEDALARQRNECESALEGMYEAVTGRRPAWGCGFGSDEAVKEVAQIHAELEARLTTPVRLPAAKDTSQGWTIDPDYLSAIAEKVGYSEDEGTPSMETVEAVLLATGFTVGREIANAASAEGQLVTAMGYQGGRNS